MNNSSSSDNYPQALSFAPFGSGLDDNSESKAMGLRSAAKSLWRISLLSRKKVRQVERPFIEPVLVSRYEVDDFGQPRILSSFEAHLHALAWPVLIGVVLGFGLAVSLLVVPNVPTPKSQQIASMEARP